jgi:hypothetical protein
VFVVIDILEEVGFEECVKLVLIIDEVDEVMLCLFLLIIIVSEVVDFTLGRVRLWR